MNDTEIRIKQIIYQLPDAIVVCDHQARIRYINPASADLLGISLQEAVGKPFADIVTLIDEQTDEPIEDISQKAMQSGQDETAGSNALLLASDGLTELPVEVIARPLTTNDQSINGALVTIHDVRLARFSRRQLSWNASHDSLTGIFNRFEFDRQAHALLLTAKRDNSRHSLLLIDIDHFKHLNEMTDHITGDHLLIKLSELLRSLLRANDSLFRSAADQFLILLPHCQLATAAKIAENIRQQIENMTVDVDGGFWPVTASIGVTELTQTGAASITEVMYEVESACYAAKKQGRNQVSLFDSEQSKQLTQALMDIKEALHLGQFHLYYQVIESTNAQAPLCEIFIRRIDETGNAFEPASFLPLCERSGLIVELDAWVIRTFLDQMALFPEELRQFARVHINLSAYSFASRHFLEEMEALLSNYQLPKDFLCFEVSESSLLKNLSHSQQFMQKLSALGCRFVVDDVDANLTAFDIYTALPIDMIKIDASLIDSIRNTASGAVIVRTINELAQNAEIRTVAQHVQDFALFEWLQNNGIDYAQGFALHAPKPLVSLF